MGFLSLVAGQRSGQEHRMAKHRQLTPEDVDRIAECDEARQAYFERLPDRPDGKFVKPHGRVAPEVRRAQGRLRTARWRSKLDRKRAPTVSQVGMALATALATLQWSTPFSKIDCELLERALADLKERGFDIDEVRKTLRRLRIKLVEPEDRQGEESESTGPAIVPSAQEDERTLPF
jgi:hypothetical protein